MEIVFRTPQKLSSEEMEKFRCHSFKIVETHKKEENWSHVDRFAGYRGSGIRNVTIPRHIIFANSDIFEEETDTGYIYKIVCNIDKTEDVDEFLESNLSEYHEGEFDIKNMLRSILMELDCKDVTIDGFRLMDISELRNSKNFSMNSKRNSILSELGLENYAFISPESYLRVTDDRFNVPLELVQPEELEIKEFDEGFFGVQHSSEESKKPSKLVTSQEAIKFYKLFQQLKEYVLQRNPSFERSICGRWNAKCDVDNLEEMIQIVKNFDKISESKSDGTIETNSIEEANKHNTYGYSNDEYYYEYIKLKIIQEPDYLSRLINEIKEANEYSMTVDIALHGIGLALQDEIYFGNLAPEEKQKIKNLYSMEDKEFLGKIQEKMLVNTGFCNVLFDEEMDAKQILDTIKEKESGKYRFSRMPDNCRAKLIDYAIEQEDNELLDFMWKMVYNMYKTPNTAQNHEFAEKILKTVLKQQGVSTFKKYIESIKYNDELRDLYGLLDTLYGNAIEELNGEGQVFSMLSSDIKTPEGFIECFNTLKEKGIIDTRGLGEVIKGGKLHITIPEKHMGKMIGKQGTNIKGIEEKISKLMGIDKLKIILHPQKEGEIITLSQLEELIDQRNKRNDSQEEK